MFMPLQTFQFGIGGHHGMPCAPCAAGAVGNVSKVWLTSKETGVSFVADSTLRIGWTPLCCRYVSMRCTS